MTVGIPVRTASEPMAFTRAELVRGGTSAWLAFLVLMLLALVVAMIIGDLLAPARPGAASTLQMLPLVLGYAAVLGGSISFAVMLALSPLLWLVGRGLRRVRSVRVHVVSYGAVGFVIGMTAVMVVSQGSALKWSPLLPVTVAITTTAVIFGWLRASRTARAALRAAPRGHWARLRSRSVRSGSSLVV